MSDPYFETRLSIMTMSKSSISCSFMDSVVYIGFIINSLLTILTSIDNPCDMTVMMDFWPAVLVLLGIYVLIMMVQDVMLLLVKRYIKYL